MLCVETPISIRVPTIARASFTDRSSWPNMDAVGTNCRGDIGPVVDDCTTFAAPL